MRERLRCCRAACRSVGGGGRLHDAAALGLRPTELDEVRASNSNPPCIAQALERSETRTEATEALRGLIDAIVLTPDEGALRIELRGNLAAMLSAASNAKRSPESGDLSL